MNFSDEAIVISKRTLKESSYIVTVFTRTHGIYSGVARISARSKGENISEGNIIDFSWRARLDDHIGYIKTELIKSYNGYIIMDRTKLYGFQSLVSILKKAFCERVEYHQLYEKFKKFVIQLKQQDFSLIDYIELECEILSAAGHGLDLTKCAVTDQVDDLYYISPKSGRAISKSAGEPYHDKLLRFPKILGGQISQTGKTIGNKMIDSDILDYNSNDIEEMFDLTSYFLNRYIFINKGNPAARELFINHIISRSSQ